MGKRVFTALTLLGALGTAAAHPLDQQAPSPTQLSAMAAEWAAPAAPGERTRSWLELQRSGAVASPYSQALPPAVAARTHARYLQSFETPIPESLTEERGFGVGP